MKSVRPRNNQFPPSFPVVAKRRSGVYPDFRGSIGAPTVFFDNLSARLSPHGRVPAPRRHVVAKRRSRSIGALPPRHSHQRVPSSLPPPRTVPVLAPPLPVGAGILTKTKNTASPIFAESSSTDPPASALSAPATPGPIPPPLVIPAKAPNPQ